MSCVLFDTNSSDVIFATSSPVTSVTNYTLFGWAKYVAFTGSPNGEGLIYLSDGGTNVDKVYFQGLTQFGYAAGASTAAFGTIPSTSGWFAFAYVVSGTGANSATAYFRNNGDASWTSLNTLPGVSFTPTVFAIGQIGKTGVSAKFCLCKAWNAALTLSELNAQFASAANTHPANIAGDWPIGNVATAGNDISGNGFALTVSGSLTDDADFPTFPINYANLERHSNRGINRGVW